MSRASAARPCPVCAKTDWCLVAADGSAPGGGAARAEVRRAGRAARPNLDADALGALPRLGFDPDDRAGSCFTFAECDAAGEVVGPNRRFGGGGERGLTRPAGSRDRPGPPLVVERPTAAALTAAGLAAVGRPSNAGGVKWLAERLRDFDGGRESSSSARTTAARGRTATGRNP